jgi:NAD(P)-dependent dehydrogenase (short-subunit alcohol dehydrogenase family)
MRVAGEVVVVSGGAGAIGREVCLQLGREGAKLAVMDLGGEALDGLGELLERAGVEHACRAGDAADPSAVESFVAGVEQKLGAPTSLVNCAGFWKIVDFVDTAPDHWDEMIRGNLITALATCRVLAPRLVARRRGAIVNFASTAGEYGSIRPSAAYAAAKGGVIGFSKSLARELSPHGVRVNVISPGPIETPALRLASEADRQVAASRTLLGRLGTPADIAAGVLYLVSEESSFVTGEVLRVNGGSLI